MSSYEERFHNSEVHSKLDSLRNRLEFLINENTNPDAIDHITRLINVIIYVKNTLNNVNPLLVPENLLDKLNGTINNIEVDLNNYNNSKDIAILSAVNSKIDSVINNIQQLPKIETISDLINYSEISSELNKSIESMLNRYTKKEAQFDEKMNITSGKIDDIIKIIDQQKQVMLNQLSQFQGQFSEAENRRRESFDNEVNQRNEIFQNLQQQINNDINVFKDDRKRQVDNIISEFKKQTENDIKSLKNISDALCHSQEKEADDTITYLNEKRSEAKQLLNIIANIGVTGNYNKIANQERKTANALRYASLSFMVCSIIIVGTIAFNIYHNGFDWRLILLRIGVGIIMVIPALYTARESDRHRQREISNRKMELELASIGPYLELLPEEKRDDLKAKLTEKFFGQPEIISVTEKGDLITAGSLWGLLEKIVTTLVKK